MSAGHALPVWLVVFALAYLRGYRQPLALAPFVAGLTAALVVEPVLRLQVSTLEEKGQLRWPRAGLRSPLTLGATLAFLGATGFLWLEGERNPRRLGALLALGLALVVLYLRFERRAGKPKPAVDPDAPRSV